MFRYNGELTDCAHNVRTCPLSYATVRSSVLLARANQRAGGFNFIEKQSGRTGLKAGRLAVRQPLADASARLSTVWCDGLLDLFINVFLQ